MAVSKVCGVIWMSEVWWVLYAASGGTLRLRPTFHLRLASEVNGAHDYNPNTEHTCAFYIPHDNRPPIIVVNPVNDADDGGTPTHVPPQGLTPQLTYHPTHITTFTLAKRATHLDPFVPLSKQLLSWWGRDRIQLFTRRGKLRS
ncbi:uncharacterized protein LACBIDRAFT_333118 [Laccaria bicolor S238N-H82]|uniref:Predicted protein n=1 Tax=Laccaria bicolor (strain S238N-H82 / ATCC MYA-4686) TaxID=486041 RepID=B0DUY3_LACBS|nr:uncharacterized protein LACBIDRAFT_333118 [Laccaria bicolor S238N-H82]EDR01689.1 predicted protein [Laccaria bicolor S238N-H82]|eukprot:XP_001887765.1 predicted protein [Laccaria bicolor S238N-H82]